MVKRMPQPPLGRFAADNTPPLLYLCRFPAPHFDRDRVQTTPFHDAFVDPREAGGFFLIP
jgi:hypothetical protein